MRTESLFQVYERALAYSGVRNYLRREAMVSPGVATIVVERQMLPPVDQALTTLQMACARAMKGQHRQSWSLLWLAAAEPLFWGGSSVRVATVVCAREALASMRTIPFTCRAPGAWGRDASCTEQAWTKHSNLRVQSARCVNNAVANSRRTKHTHVRAPNFRTPRRWRVRIEVSPNVVQIFSSLSLVAPCWEIATPHFFHSSSLLLFSPSP